VDDKPSLIKLECLKRRTFAGVSKVYEFLQTPFGATAGGGLFVVLVAEVRAFGNSVAGPCPDFRRHNGTLSFSKRMRFLRLASLNILLYAMTS
jgi:hypothetical protein